MAQERARALVQLALALAQLALALAPLALALAQLALAPEQARHAAASAELVSPRQFSFWASVGALFLCDRRLLAGACRPEGRQPHAVSGRQPHAVSVQLLATPVSQLSAAALRQFSSEYGRRGGRGDGRLRR